MSSIIQTGETEPVEIYVTDIVGDALLGKTDIKLRIRRHADGYYLDWSDDTFKIAGSVVTMLEALSEVDATNSPGMYALDTATHKHGLDTNAITNPGTNDIYAITVLQDGGADATGLPTNSELKVGFWADQIGGVPVSVANAVWNAMQADHVVQGSFGELLLRVEALKHGNHVLDNLVYNSQNLIISGRMRLFTTKTAVAAATDGGTGEGEFASYSFTTTVDSQNDYRADVIRASKDS
jgi:hypothetical protein